MDTLVNKRSALKGKITRAEREADTLGTPPIDRIAVEVDLELLDSLGSEIRTLEDDIYAACTSEDEYNEHHTHLSDMLKRYKSVKCKLLKLLTPGGPAQPSPGSTPTTPVVAQSTSQVKLPKLELPRFSGGLLEWVSFRDRFRAAVHDKALPGSLKLQYLKGQLDGVAAAFLEGVQLSNDAYDEAWASLVKRFENRRELARAHLERFLHLRPVTKDSSESLRSLVDTTRECLRTLKNLGLPTESWDFFVCHSLSSKLTPDLRREWERTFVDDSFPKLEDFVSFLDREARSYAACSIAHADPSQLRPVLDRKPTHLAIVPMVCYLCQQPHPLFRCSKFLAMTAEDRRDWVKSQQLCLNCLRGGHTASACDRGVCRTCNRKHHTLLHVDITPKESLPATNHSTQPFDGTVLLATAIVMVRDSYGQYQEVRCLLDNGSMSTFVREDCAQRLALPKQKVHTSFIGVGESQQCTTKAAVDLFIKSRTDDDFELQVQAHVLPSVTSMQPAMRIRSDSWTHLKQLSLADPSFNVPSRVDVILGADAYNEILATGILKGHDGAPTATCTRLGWVVSGPVAAFRATITQVSMHACCELEKTVQKFWSLESIPETKIFSPEEQDCEKHFLQTFSRTADGRFITRLPFKSTSNPIGDSRSMAVRRFYQCETKLTKNPVHHAKYNAVLQEYIDLGHMEEVPALDLRKPPSQVFYLPHHGIVKESSTTTKLRVVFDASAKSSSGASLNGNLMIGPTIQDDIFSILVRSRKHQILITADVEKMYRQILVHPDDRDYQGILWRQNPNSAIKEYRLRTVTFGVASAPFQAIRSLRKLAELSAQQYPLASKAILEDFYVDDLISGADSLPLALQLKQELLELLPQGGFPLKKWSSSSEDLLATIPPDCRETQIPLTLDSTTAIKTLGIRWHPAHDEFSFVVNYPAPDPLTKRRMLSLLAKVYDPLGWLSPVTIRGKMLFQSLWCTTLDWDDEVDTQMQSAWSDYLADLKELSKITLKRCVVIAGAVSHQLHCFADASEKAISSAVFLRSVDHTGSVLVKLVAAKTQVVPKKKKSLPKLELEAALLLSKLTASVQKAMKLSFESIHAYTDSTITHSWIIAPPHRWVTYVSNRVAAIQEVILPDSWHHVPGAQNPADCGSRGITADDLIGHSLWWQAPTWVKDGVVPKQAPLLPLMPPNDEDTAAHLHYFAGYVASSNDFLERFSSYNTLIRISAYCSRYAFNLKQGLKGPRRTGWLTTDELPKSEVQWVKVIQGQAFDRLLDTLRRNSVHPDSSQPLPGDVAKLNPFIDTIDGTIRVGGRLQQSTLSFGKKHPMLLPKRSRFTDLLLRYEHERHLHAPPQLLLSVVQQRFWIIGARDAARRITQTCVRCHRFKAESAQQLMAPLPPSRTAPSSPFLNTGIDFAGPVILKNMKGRAGQTYKGYIALFVCFSTKAIHLELVESLTTQACIDAILRFISRRGKPLHIISDSGRNFVGAKRRLTELERLTSSSRHNEAIAKELTDHAIKWQLNPPYAPHFGGLWEAGIKSMKYHLHRVLGNSVLNHAEMTTLLARVEACLNSRPLTAMSTDPNDLEPLTPGHFLIGRPLCSLPANAAFDKLSHLTRWHLMQKILQHFWRRWSREYLTRLQSRPKWWRQTHNLKPNDLVVVKEDDLPPQRWHLGRIVKTHPGKDGLVRTATIRTQDGEIKRTIVKLSPLPYDD